MPYALSHFATWLGLIFAIGALTGLLTRQSESPTAMPLWRREVSPWLLWSLVIFAVGLLAALLNAPQGRAGLWLETGLGSFVSFFIGACVGTLGRSGNFREHKGWAFGLLPATVAWFAANSFETPKIEASLAAHMDCALKNAGAAGLGFSLDGRDVTLDRSAPDALRAALANVEGVRLVEVGDTAPSNAMSSATQAADAVGSADERPADRGKRVVASQTSSTVNPTAEERARSGREQLATLPSSGALDLVACQTGLNATQAVEKIQFHSGSSRITRSAATVLDRLTPLLRRCPETKVEISSHTDNVGDDEDNRALSRRRAEAVMRYLIREGISAARLSAIGYGAKKPLASNDTEDGRSENRRIEFLLK